MDSKMIYAIGRNYVAHAQELGHGVNRGSPIVFFKPPASIVKSGATVQLPAFSQDVQFETEVAFKFGPELEISELCIANDLTARDKQREAQKNLEPWGLAKGFKSSCGLGNWVKAKNINLQDLKFTCELNGKLAQEGHTKNMIFDFETIRAYLTENFPVEADDIVLTGTTSGVRTLKPGDHLKMELVGLSQATWKYE